MTLLGAASQSSCFCTCLLSCYVTFCVMLCMWYALNHGYFLPLRLKQVFHYQVHCTTFHYWLYVTVCSALNRKQYCNHSTFPMACACALLCNGFLNGEKGLLAEHLPEFPILPTSKSGLIVQGSTQQHDLLSCGHNRPDSDRSPFPDSLWTGADIWTLSLQQFQNVVHMSAGTDGPTVFCCHVIKLCLCYP